MSKSSGRDALMMVLWSLGILGLILGFLYFMQRMTEPPRTRRAATPPGSQPADRAKPRGPGEVDDAFIAHVQAGRYREAYALMTRAYQATVPFADFRDAVSRNAYLKSSRLIGCHSVVTYANRVHLRECVMRAPVGWVYTTLHYGKDDGEWRLTGIMLGGTPALPGHRQRPPTSQPAAAPGDGGRAP